MSHESFPGVLVAFHHLGSSCGCAWSGFVVVGCRMRSAIYARVSDEKLREDGLRVQDVERQVARLLTFQSAMGEIPEVFADDGVSAFKEDFNSRPDFLRLLREIRANRVHKVYVESLDRISRRVVDGLQILQEIARHNCTVVSIAEGEIDITTSKGWLSSGIFLLMAEWSSRDKADKVRSGMDRARNDKRKICRSCGVVHLGRHPKACECLKCRRKKGGGV